MTERAVVICARVDSVDSGELVVEGSAKIAGGCGHELWLSPTGREIVEARNASTLCASCASATLPTASAPRMIGPSPAQLAEISRTVGRDLSEGDVAAMMARAAVDLGLAPCGCVKCDSKGCALPAHNETLLIVACDACGRHRQNTKKGKGRCRCGSQYGTFAGYARLADG